MEVGKCKLCGLEKPLLKKSHIIPNWMYFGLFDDAHKTSMVDLDTKKYKRPSTGVYESMLLCRECDGDMLGSLEAYGKRVMCSDNKFIDFFNSETNIFGGNMKTATFTVDNYCKFKLFLLGLLWKMHTSSQPFFKHVDLGGKHADRLRTAILNNEYIPDDQYEVAIVAIENLPDVIIKMISLPRRIKQNGNTYYIALINGLFFMFNISSENKQDLIVKSRLQKDGRMLVPLLEGSIARIFYDSMFGVTIRRKLTNESKA